MIINDLDGYYIVFDTKNWNTELDTLFAKSSELNDNSIRPIRNATLYCTKRNCLVLDFMRHLRNSFCHALLKKGGKSVSIIR